MDSTARPADKKAVSANANLKLPDGVQVMGTDAQLVQVELKAGEELSAEPGAMAYMSPNVRSITSLQGGLVAGLTRLLAGEPFFLNNFKNVAKDGRDGYIALAGRREGDKIIVLDLAEMGGEFLCARDSYLCSKGDVDIGAASTFMRGQMGLRVPVQPEHDLHAEAVRYGHRVRQRQRHGYQARSPRGSGDGGGRARGGWFLQHHRLSAPDDELSSRRCLRR